MVDFDEVEIDPEDYLTDDRDDWDRDRPERGGGNAAVMNHGSSRQTNPINDDIPDLEANNPLDYEDQFRNDEEKAEDDNEGEGEADDQGPAPAAEEGSVPLNGSLSGSGPLHFITKADYNRRMVALKQQEKWVEKAARR